MCPLQIISDIEPLSLTLHGVNTCFIHYLFNVKNYLIGYKSETVQPKEKSAKPSYKFMDQNSLYPSLQKFGTFLTSGNWYLMAQWTTQR